MTQKQKSLIETLIASISDEQKNVYKETAQYLVDLGYMPQKQRVGDFVLSFKHKETGKVISKMGIRQQTAFFSVRFFACNRVSETFMNALRKDIESRNRQYTSPLPVLPDTASMVKNKCGYCGDICTGGGYGYYYKFSDNDMVSRCGAYPIIIPDIKEEDIDELKRIIQEQHHYFSSIA